MKLTIKVRGDLMIFFFDKQYIFLSFLFSLVVLQFEFSVLWFLGKHCTTIATLPAHDTTLLRAKWEYLSLMYFSWQYFSYLQENKCNTNIELLSHSNIMQLLIKDFEQYRSYLKAQYCTTLHNKLCVVCIAVK
jgi:hypothetical protein